MSAAPVGRLAGLWRYPVKSMAGQALEAAEVSWHGVEGDRRWAFVRAGLPRSGFPWLTIRQRADLWRHVPWFADPDRPDDSVTMVRTPDGEDLEVVDPALAGRFGPGVTVLKQDRGVFDSSPLSLITTPSVQAAGDLSGADVEVRRFRPNLVVEPVADEPFQEDAWLGRVLRVGELRLRVDRRDPRCVVVNVDPETGERTAAILRAIAQQRENCLGVYGAVVTPGRVAVGDAVVVEPQ